ncbi:hypothetical protein [Pedobacter aquatilis]|uniref:hypothetical protein n=1 Tax=Pedobacter aquatilis TaxID=351343 RepID=UPI00292D2E45|nr:hypothetical protein [Pedobacter aquatilis]
MRKLCLIIPLLVFPILSFAADGIDGCHIVTGVTNQSRLYHTPYTAGAGSPTQWIETSEGHAGWNALTATRCFNTTNIPCEVYIYGSSTITPASTSVIYAGYYAVITTNCPIDDYVPVFFIFTAGIGCISIANRQKNINENIHHNGCI